MSIELYSWSIECKSMSKEPNLPSAAALRLAMYVAKSSGLSFLTFEGAMFRVVLPA